LVNIDLTASSLFDGKSSQSLRISDSNSLAFGNFGIGLADFITASSRSKMAASSFGASTFSVMPTKKEVGDSRKSNIDFGSSEMDDRTHLSGKRRECNANIESVTSEMFRPLTISGRSRNSAERSLIYDAGLTNLSKVDKQSQASAMSSRSWREFSHVNGGHEE
jgi:hypothetical protein